MKIKDVTKVYRTEAGNVEALRGVSLELPERGMVFITGRSGSGKSTLLNVLSGLDSFDGGSIEVCGRELKTLGRAELDTYRNSCCGFVFQEYNLIPELNVRQNVELSLQLQGRKDNGEAVKNALEKVELSGFEERKVYELSGGQKQRVAIARAIVKKPAIIFADEPTGALDEKTGRSILELMKKLSRESLIIAVTHEKEFAEEYGDRIIEIADGEVAQDRIKTEIKCEQGAVKWEKPKMPTGAAVKIGFSNFKFHPLRLAVTVLLAAIAFALIGVAVNIATEDNSKYFFDAIYDKGVKYTAIEKYEMYYHDGVIIQDFFIDDRRDQKEMAVTADDAELMKEVYDEPVFLFHQSIVADYQGSFATTVDEMPTVIPEDCEINSSGYLHIEKEDCEKLGLSVTGRLPENSAEVAITERLLNSFICFGLKEDGKKYKISSAEDMIGHKIFLTGGADLYTVTGIVTTGCGRECFNSHGYLHPHDKIYVSEDFKYDFRWLMCPVSADKEEFGKLFDFVLGYEVNNIVYQFYNKLSTDYYGSIGIMAYWKYLCVYISIAVLVLAIGFLIDFIASSLRGQMKQIGILMSMGAGFKDIAKVYGGCTACICAVIFALSVAASAIAVEKLNGVLMADCSIAFRLMGFSPYILLILLGLIAVCAAIGCLVPLLRYRRFTPVQMLTKGQIK